MEGRTPSIACIGVIGRSVHPPLVNKINTLGTSTHTSSQNNPLHISLFPATGPGYESERNKLEYSFMLNSCLDIFEARIPTKTIGHDFGLLHALDERIAMYGWVTNTGVKLVIVVDMEGRPANSAGPGKAAILGLKDRDLAPVCEDSCCCG
jgi:hypothetical protein